MASFIPGITDAIPDTPLYHPDMGFFNSMLMRKTQEYNQGQAAVQSAYGSVMNAPLSDAANIPLRDQYMKDAQNKMKDLSQSDLSLDANVQSAENVFSPFWNDDMMVKDVATTKWYQSQVQAGLAMRDNPDAKVNSQYSDVAMQYLQQGLNKLKNAGRDPNAYAKIENRRFTAFQNIPAELDAAVAGKDKADGFSDTTATAHDGYIYKNVNGPQSQGKFSSFAMGHITPQMLDQFRITGSVNHQNSIDAFKQSNPTATDQQAEDAVAKDAINDLAGGHQKNIDNFNAFQDSLDARIGQYVKSKTKLTNDQFDILNGLKAQRDSNKKNITAETNTLNSLKGQSGAPYTDLYQKMTQNPDNYWGGIVRNQTLENWAISAASNTTGTEMKSDETWKAHLEAQHQADQLNFDYAGLKQKSENDLANNQIKRDEINEKYDARGEARPDGTTGPNGAAGNGGLPSSEFFTGQATVDAAKTADPGELRRQDMAQRAGQIRTGIMGIDGAAGSLVSPNGGLKGVSSQEVVLMDNADAKKMSNPDYVPSPDEAAATQKIKSTLSKSTGKSINSDADLRNAVLTYSENQLNGRAHDAATPLDNGEQARVNQNGKIRDNMAVAASDQKLYGDMLHKYITGSNDSDVKKLVTSADGPKRLLNENDFARTFKPIQAVDEDGNTVTISPKQQAKSYVSGDWKGIAHGIGSGGQSIKINVGDKEYSVLNPTEAIEKAYDVENRYGSSLTVAKTLKTTDQNIVPNLPQYQAKTGTYGNEFRMNMPTEEPKNGRPSDPMRLSQDLSNPSNIEGMYINGELQKSDSADKALVLKALGSTGDRESKSVTGFTMHSRSDYDGKKMVHVDFASNKANDASGISGKSVDITISPDAQGEMINRVFPQTAAPQVYGAMQNGKSFGPSPVQKITGYNAYITPNADNTGVWVSGDYPEFDAATGKSVMRYENNFISFTGSKGKTPDEIYRAVYQTGYAYYMSKNQDAKKQFQNNIPADQNSNMTGAEWAKQNNYTK